MRTAITLDAMIIRKMGCHPLAIWMFIKCGAKDGPTAAPIDPVPSIIADTVAIALKVVTVQAKLADTAVVIKAYGPLMNRPRKNSVMHRINVFETETV